MNSGRMVFVVCFAWGLLLAAGCGGGNGRAKVPPEFAARIDAIGASLMRGGRGFLHMKEFAETERLFDAIPEGEGRRAAARAFGDMLLSARIAQLPYLLRESATGVYAPLYVCQCFNCMRRCGVSTRAAIEFFFKGLSVYRNSCLTIPTEKVLAGETPEETRNRLYCARILGQDYEMCMTIFKKIWLPDLSRYLPPEYHDEFRRRLKAFELPEASSAPAAPSSRATSKP